MSISYEVFGNGKYSLIYLHGWMMDKKAFKNNLINGYRSYLLDLPGFGNSNLDRPYSIDDYVFELHNFIVENKIENVILIGHSFGGRIAIKYASIYNICGVVLVDSAGINMFSFKKLFNRLFKRGSRDYLEAKGLLRKTMVNVVNEDLRNCLKNIKASCLIIYGKRDKITPLKMARFLNKGINDSGLVIVPKSGHFPFLENRYYFNKTLEAFLVNFK